LPYVLAAGLVLATLIVLALGRVLTAGAAQYWNRRS
jgi:hypothetical protein